MWNILDGHEKAKIDFPSKFNPRATLRVFARIDDSSNLLLHCSSIAKQWVRYFRSPKNKQIEVSWHFEEDDLDMKECGQDFSAMVNIPFTLIEEEE